MNFIFGFNDGPHITCLSWKCKALTYSLRIPRATYVSIFFFFLLFIVTFHCLTGWKKIPSHATKWKPAHVETSISLHIWKMPAAIQKSKIAANFQNVYAKQFVLHKLYPNLRQVDHWGLILICGPAEQMQLRVSGDFFGVVLMRIFFILQVFFKSNLSGRLCGSFCCPQLILISLLRCCFLNT